MKIYAIVELYKEKNEPITFLTDIKKKLKHNKAILFIKELHNTKVRIVYLVKGKRLAKIMLKTLQKENTKNLYFYKRIS